MAILEDTGIDSLAAGQQIQFAHTANNVSGVLAVACAASDTTISLSPGGGALFPAAPFYCSIEFEVLWCLSKSGDNLIVQRGMDGTAAASHVVGISVEMRNNAGLWTDAYNAINSVSTDVGTLQSSVTNKTVMPPDTVYLDTTQELTHKTIDLTTPSKQNVIIGNVSPDPAQLVYQNILNNGGFEEWATTASTTLAAGTPTSGSRNALFSNYWYAYGINDSAITCARDTANTDPGNQSGVDTLINVTTVQAADTVQIYQVLTPGQDGFGLNDHFKIAGAPISVSVRAKALSGNVTMAISLYHNDSSSAELISAFTAIPTSYTTFKFENQVWLPAASAQSLSYLLAALKFKGVGQIAIDSVMIIVGSVATNYRAKLSLPASTYNLLVNGGFEVWQRGAGPFTGQNVYTCDRWQTNVSGTDSISVQRVAGNGSKYAAQFGVNHGTGTLTALYQTIEDVSSLAGKPITFSCDVYVATPGAVRLTFSNQTARVGIGAYHPGGGTWIRLATTYVVSGGDTLLAATIENNNASASAILDNATLVVGNVPAAYVPPHPADELSRDLRYYEIMVPNSPMITGLCTLTTGCWCPYAYKFKPVTPTITFSPVNSFFVIGPSGSAVAVTSILASVITQSGCRVDCATAGGLVVGQATILQAALGTALITVEANP